MKHFLMLTVCALLYPLAWVEERKRKQQADERMFADWLAWQTAQTIPPPRVIASDEGVIVHAASDAEAAEIVAISPAFFGSTHEKA